jgi:hypothetical protein
MLTTTFFSTTVSVGSTPRDEGRAGRDASFLAAANAFLEAGAWGPAPTTAMTG